MSIVTWDKFYDEVAPETPGAALPIVQNAIRNAAIEFCEKSWIWRVEIEPLTVVANTTDYELELPENGMRIVSIRYLKKDNAPFTPVSSEVFLLNGGDYYSKTPDSITIRDTTAGSVITGMVIVAPTYAATGVDDSIYQRHRNHIAAGAKARLFSMTNVPWADQPKSVEMKYQFDADCGSARAAADRSFVRATNIVRSHSF